MASDHEDEDDDLYGTPDVKDEQSKGARPEHDGSSGDEPMDEGADSGDDDEDDDDDDDEDSESVSRAWTCAWHVEVSYIRANRLQDLEIIIDKPPTAPKPAAYVPHSSHKVSRS